MEKNNSMYQIFEFIEQNKLTAQQTSISWSSSNGFILAKKMLLTMNNFCNNIECVTIEVSDCDFGNNKLSHLFFHKNSLQSKFTMPNLQILAFMFSILSGCTIDILLDLLFIILHQKQFSGSNDQSDLTVSIPHNLHLKHREKDSSMLYK